MGSILGSSSTVIKEEKPDKTNDNKSANENVSSTSSTGEETEKPKEKDEDKEEEKSRDTVPIKEKKSDKEPVTQTTEVILFLANIFNILIVFILNRMKNKSTMIWILIEQMNQLFV